MSVQELHRVGQSAIGRPIHGGTVGLDDLDLLLPIDRRERIGIDGAGRCDVAEDGELVGNGGALGRGVCDAIGGDDLIQCGAQPVQLGRAVGGDVVFGGAVVGEVVELVALGPDQTVAAVGHRPERLQPK